MKQRGCAVRDACFYLNMDIYKDSGSCVFFENVPFYDKKNTKRLNGTAMNGLNTD